MKKRTRFGELDLVILEEDASLILEYRLHTLKELKTSENCENLKRIAFKEREMLDEVFEKYKINSSYDPFIVGKSKGKSDIKVRIANLLIYEDEIFLLLENMQTKTRLCLYVPEDLEDFLMTFALADATAEIIMEYVADLSNYSNPDNVLH